MRPQCRALQRPNAHVVDEADQGGLLVWAEAPRPGERCKQGRGVVIAQRLLQQLLGPLGADAITQLHIVAIRYPDGHETVAGGDATQPAR